jgi:hypothetical protein
VEHHDRDAGARTAALEVLAVAGFEIERLGAARTPSP